jgi:IS4 transposase
MQNTTPIFPGFHLGSLRRKPRSTQQKLAAEIALLKQKNLDQLGQAFGTFIPDRLLSPSEKGEHSRRRLYTKRNTFWAFIGQLFSDDGSCQEVVQKLKAYAALRGLDLPSSGTAAYCKARSKLSMDDVLAVHKHVTSSMEQLGTSDAWHGHRVIVVDGTGTSMPDTDANQAVWPQQRHQKPGCGFPSMRLTACFSLHTGALLSYSEGNKHSSEIVRLREQLDTLKHGDILLGDKAFCGYRDVCERQSRGIETVASMSRRIPVKETEAVKILGPGDVLVRWRRPKKLTGMSTEQAQALPPYLLLRQTKITVSQPGFRSQTIYLITTLLDPQKYPASDLADLYFRRWDVELFFRDIKTVMGMDILRCKTPAMIRKELLMYFIAYNCIRRIMYEAAEEADIPVRLVSFKTSLQTLRSWEPNLNQARISKKERFRLISLLYESITQNPIRQRPGRSEPRAVKRRPKNHQLLTCHRSEMHVPSHRNNNWLNKGKEA